MVSIVLQAVKVRLYPDSAQKEALEKAFGTTRWLWNYFFNLTNETYKETGKGISRFDMNKMLPKLKEEYPWLKDTYSQYLQAVTLNLSRAFINFFEKRAKYPTFKSKLGKQSLTFPQNVKVKNSEIKFPKLGSFFAVIHRPIEGKVKTVTITKNSSHEYYASILTEDGKDLPIPPSPPLKGGRRGDGKAIGIDLGLTHFAIISDGSKYDNPRWLEGHEKNLKQKQKDLSRKQKGSRNRNKARRKVARVHNKISRSREDFQHKLSRRIVDENQVIIVENLNIKGMVKNHSNAKGINQVGWGQFLTMLKYKAERAGKIYFEVDRFFPSSKACNNCLNVVGSLPLDIREWTCEHCGRKHDRDINAALNIRDEGLRILTSEGIKPIAQM